MTLEDAIKHEEEVAATSCDKCREEHEQLASWLKELKTIKKEAIIIPNDGTPWEIAQLIINAKRIVRDTRYIGIYMERKIKTFNKKEIKALGKHLLNYAETEEELSESHR